MPSSGSSVALDHIFSRDSSNASVLVADGYGLSLSVSRGHLLVRDGLGRHRRERKLPRAQRAVRRIVILGHTGHLTLEALRWCADTGIALIQLDTDGTTLLTAGQSGTDDARLRRAQAAAANSPGRCRPGSPPPPPEDQRAGRRRGDEPRATARRQPAPRGR